MPAEASNPAVNRSRSHAGGRAATQNPWHVRAPLLLGVIAGVLALSGQAAGRSPSWNGTYTVRPGDSLIAIAHQVGVSIDALADANRLNVRKPLPIGVILHIPPAPVVAGAASLQWRGSYVVEPGDALSILALHYHVSLKALAAANRLNLRKPLHVGITLRVPVPATPTRPARPRWKGTYVVQPGDTLSTLALHDHVTLTALAAANGLDPKQPLHVGLTLHVPAPPPPSHSAAPRWKGTYVVQAGDTLSTLALHYHITLTALAAANGLDPKQPLHVGLTLHVPAPPPPSHSAAPRWKGTYVVQAGDTLSTLALHYHITLTALAAANRLDPRKPIQVGISLHVPRGRTATAPPAPTRPHWEGIYVVQPGDTLGLLALHYHVSLPTLATANALDPAGVLRIGARLHVPAAPRAAVHWSGLYVVRPGDSLSAIAVRYHLSVARLAAVDNLNPAGVLFVGARLRVPSGEAAIVDLAQLAESEPYEHGAVGYDLSFPSCASPLPTGQAFTVIGLNGGRPFTPNPCFVAEWTAASPPRSVYINTAFGSPLMRHITPDCASAAAAQPLSVAGQDAYAVGCSEGEADWQLLGSAQPQVIWLDVESANTWSPLPGLNVATLEGLLEQLLGHTPRPVVGVYSNADYWTQITGNWSGLSAPEWVAPSVTDPPGCPASFSAGPVWLGQSINGLLDTDTVC